MGHTNVVEVSLAPVPKSKCYKNVNFEDDHTFDKRCDYGGEPVDNYEKELKNVKADLSLVASVNLRKRTIRFHSKQSVRKAYLKSLRNAFRNHKDLLKEGECRNWKLVKDVEQVCGIDYLYLMGFCRNGGDIVEDYLNGKLPQTLYIGAILDAHC